MSVNFKNIPAYKPGRLSLSALEIVKNLVHTAVDHVAPGLGKKEKAHVVDAVAKIVHKVGIFTKKAAVKATKTVLGDPTSYLAAHHPNIMSAAGRLAREGPRNMSATTKSGGYAIGGVTAAPVALSSNINRKSKPRMRNIGSTVIVSHSEMLGAIVSGSPTSNVSAFRCVGYRANPGMSTIFPWLSSMAVNYEKYRFTRLSFTLVPLVSTSFNGRIGVGFDFDSSDVVPGNRQEFYALSTHAENMPWQGCTINIKCDGNSRFTGTHVASDNKLIDLGQVVVMSDAISSITAALPIYDLIVDYTVELIDPQQALFSSQLFAFNSNLTSGIPLGTGIDLTTVNGPTVVSSTTVTASVVTFNLPAGVYEVSYFIGWSTGTAAVVPTVPTTGAGSKLSNTSTGSNSYGVCFVNSPVECSLLLTATGTAWNANLTKFNVCVARTCTQVYNAYFS